MRKNENAKFFMPFDVSTFGAAQETNGQRRFMPELTGPEMAPLASAHSAARTLVSS